MDSRTESRATPPAAPVAATKSLSPNTPALIELATLLGQRKAILDERWHEVENEPESERDNRIMNTPEAWR